MPIHGRPDESAIISSVKSTISHPTISLITFTNFWNVANGKYLYRGVIRERDILKGEDGMVTFRYLDAKTGKYRTREVTGEEFLSLLMLHVLAQGLSQGTLLRFSASVQQKTHPVSPAGAPGKPVHIIQC